MLSIYFNLCSAFLFNFFLLLSFFLWWNFPLPSFLFLDRANFRFYCLFCVHVKQWEIVILLFAPLLYCLLNYFEGTRRICRLSSVLAIWFEWVEPNFLAIVNLQGIPEQAEVPPVARGPATAPGGGLAANPPTQTPQAGAPSVGPNANPLDLFPQVCYLNSVWLKIWLISLAGERRSNVCCNLDC